MGTVKKRHLGWPALNSFLIALTADHTAPVDCTLEGLDEPFSIRLGLRFVSEAPSTRFVFTMRGPFHSLAQ